MKIWTICALSLPALLALTGCEKEADDARTSTRAAASRTEIEADHNASTDRRIVCSHAMYVGEILLEEPAPPKPSRPDAKRLGKELKKPGLQTASQSRNVPAPPPATEYLR